MLTKKSSGSAEWLGRKGNGNSLHKEKEFHAAICFHLVDFVENKQNKVATCNASYIPTHRNLIEFL
jgi:hypothetical protein